MSLVLWSLVFSLGLSYAFPAGAQMNTMDKIPPELWSALHHEDLMKRNRAWEELLGYARNQYPNDEDPARALERILIELLNSEYSDIRAHAVEELGRMRISSATERICSLLGDSNFNVRHAAMVALGKINNPTAVPALLGQLQHARDIPLIISTLAEIDHPSAVAAIDAALKDPSPFIRVEAIQGVIDGHYINAVPILIEMTRDFTELQPSSDGGPTPTVAGAAAQALNELREIAATSTIEAHKYTEESLDLLESYFRKPDKN